MHAAHHAGRHRVRLRPSPGGLVRLRDGRSVVIRSALPGDGAAVQQFVRELSPVQLDRLVGAHDPRNLSLVALSANAGEPRIVAMAQYATDDPGAAEFAVVAADAWGRQGLGVRLLELLLECAALLNWPIREQPLPQVAGQRI